MKEKPYQKLPGRGRRSGAFTVSASRSTLWLGADHLLSLDFTVAAESYRRFYFRDIEAIVVQRNGVRTAWTWGFVVITLVTAGPFAIGFANSRDTAQGVTAAIAAAFGVVLLLVNWLRGPSVSVFIRTAAQVELLPSLNRLSTAQKGIARIRERITEVQGALDPTRVAAADWSLGGSLAGAFREPELSAAAPKPIHHENGKMHAALFGLLLVDSGLTFFDAYSSSGIVNGINLGVMLVAIFVLIFALRRQSNSDLPDSVRRLTWVTLGYYAAAFLTGVIYGVVYTVRHQVQVSSNDPSVFRGEPGFMQVMLISGTVAFLIGATGLIALARRRATPPPLT